MHGLRPTRADIDLGALLYNFRQVRLQAGSARQVLAVVKADAYGHGAARVALALQAAGADQFGVALAEEGVALRQAGISQPILVLGSLYPGQEVDALEHELIPVVFDLAMGRRLSNAARAAGRIGKYHLKVDTGMARVGVRPEDLAAVLVELAVLPRLEMVGLMSHLALADDLGHPFTDLQIERFRQVRTQVQAAGFAPEFVHLSNSAAIFCHDLPECNLVRPGISLYGGLPSDQFAGRLELRPVMSLRTAIAQLKEVPAGTGVSYGHRFVAERPTLLATLPIGYADGYSRLLSNRGEGLVRGRRVRVAGTVCMDWTLLDVTDVPGVAVGDPVTLLGREGDQAITAEEWAARIGTINYEVFCLVGKRVPRIYREAGVGDPVPAGP
jgi:alanine racemase